MELTFTAEQAELRGLVRSFLAATCPESEVRRLMATERGYDEAVWSRLAGELGLAGLGVPEEYGGAGCGPVELGVVFEEMGAALYCGPFLATVGLAANALLASGDAAACAEHLPGIAAGERIATLATGGEDGRWDEAGVRVAAEPDGAGWALRGRSSFVLDGHVADLVLVAARTPAGVGLFAVDGAATGLTRTLLSTVDQTRKLARLDLAATPARLVGAEGAGWSAVEHALRHATVALAAEQVGGAGRLLAMTTDYAKVRVQFGRPIGSYQAVKHRCADMLVDVEQARSTAYYAAWAAATGDPDLPVAVSLAKTFCSSAYVRAARSAIQLHGGIGFTWEHPAHLYLKRATSSEPLFGTPARHRALLAGRVGV